MFGFGAKNRTEEAVKRAVRASLLNAYLHPDEIDVLGLNENAFAWLLTESYAHHLFILGVVFTKYCKDRWATFDFFVESVVDGMKESQDKDNGPDVSELASILLNRFNQIQSLSAADRVSGRHYIESGMLVEKQDSRADVSSIAKMLENSSKKYLKDVTRMFNS